ncbi:MAG: 1-deoxy-D-xylulose-5-phosphate reductoisomerase [Bacillota bacterium]
MTRKIVILGSTGSIGSQAIDVLRMAPHLGEVVGLAAAVNFEKLAQQARELKAKNLVIYNKEYLPALSAIFAPGDGYNILHGREGLERLAALPEADVVVSAMVGSVGIRATLEALKAGKTVALANKETLVAAGGIVMNRAELGKNLLPVDSEHGGLFQCLQGYDSQSVRTLWLTASGGPFLGRTRSELEKVRPEQALRHPNWRMGGKITIDCATLMNKGLEIIEAHWLFGVEYDRIKVVIHPESIVHALVEFCDGSTLAQLAVPDMRLPIQYALSYPRREKGVIPRLEPPSLGSLHFAPPDERNFPCLRLAVEAGKCGGTMPAVLNAANEAAVQGFLKGRLSFPGIAEVVECTMERHQAKSNPDLEEVFRADAWARDEASRMIRSKE